jgi:hypothetical protein
VRLVAVFGSEVMLRSGSNGPASVPVNGERAALALAHRAPF